MYIVTAKYVSFSIISGSLFDEGIDLDIGIFLPYKR